MKHFIVEVTYLQPLEQVLAVRPEHRAFLQIGYDKGWLLCSGGQSPLVGGIVVARAPSLADLQAFFAQDPYKLKDIAGYRFVEFEPAKMQPFMADWFNPA